MISKIDALRAALLELQLAGLTYKVIDSDVSSYRLRFETIAVANKAFDLLSAFDSIVKSQFNNEIILTVDLEFDLKDKRRALFCRLSEIDFEAVNIVNDAVVVTTDNQLSDFEHLKENIFVKQINLKIK